MLSKLIGKIRPLYEARPGVSLALFRICTYGLRIAAILVALLMAAPDEAVTIGVLAASAEVAKALADFGFDTHFLRSLAQAKRAPRRRALYEQALVVKFFGVIGAVLLTLCFAAATGEIGSPLVIAFIVFSAAPLLTNFGAARSISVGRAKFLVELALPTIFLSTLAIGGVMLRGGGAGTILMIAVVAEVALAILSIKTARRSLENAEMRRCLRLADGWIMFAPALPIGLTVLVGTVFARIDVFVLKSAVSSESLASYLIASRVSEPAAFLSGALSVALMIRVSSVLSNDRAGAVRVWWRGATSIFSVAFVGAALMLVASCVLLSFGKIGDNAIYVFIGFALLVLLRAGCLACTAFIQAHGLYWVVASSSVFNLFVLLGLVLIWWDAMTAGLMVSFLFVIEFFNLLVQALCVWAICSMKLGRV